jgi:hypothetical protein
VLFAKYNYNDKVEENEMGRACSSLEGEEMRWQDMDQRRAAVNTVMNLWVP